MPFQANQQTVSGRGMMTTITNTQSGQSERVFVPTFPEGTPLAKAATTLNVALDSFAGNVRNNVAQFLPEVVPQNLRAAAKNVLAEPLVAFQNEAIAFRQTTDKAVAVAMSVVPATIATAGIRGRAVKQFDAADIAAKAAMLQNFTLEQMSGLVEVGALDQLPDGIAQAARDRFMVMSHVARTGLQAQYQKVATVNDPLASGADVDAAMAAAQAALDALKARSATVTDAANVLRSMTTAVALACDLSVDPAYALLTNAN